MLNRFLQVAADAVGAYFRSIAYVRSEIPEEIYEVAHWLRSSGTLRCERARSWSSALTSSIDSKLRRIRCANPSMSFRSGSVCVNLYLGVDYTGTANHGMKK